MERSDAVEVAVVAAQAGDDGRILDWIFSHACSSGVWPQWLGEGLACTAAEYGHATTLAWVLTEGPSRHDLAPYAETYDGLEVSDLYDGDLADCFTEDPRIDYERVYSLLDLAITAGCPSVVTYLLTEVISHTISLSTLALAVEHTRAEVVKVLLQQGRFEGIPSKTAVMVSLAAVRNVGVPLFEWARQSDIGWDLDDARSLMHMQEAAERAGNGPLVEWLKAVIQGT
eukprot:TRINITY_DN12202_c0_g1_i1.p1 TRINITY_DN12202_c0_g1~~TRINITY_DN12202_c0_g1_i1.p1  ORF type:complete len:228 (-),score=35.61 TRINITY_DN12202_c0_g1_i1:77-760(-)